MTAIDEAAKASTTDLPRWDVSDLFPSLQSREFAAAREQLGAGVARLVGLYDTHDVRGGEKVLDDEAIQAFEEVVAATNELYEEARLVGSFVMSYSSTDARDEVAAGEQGRLQVDMAQLSKLRTRFEAWVAALGPDELAKCSAVGTDHAFAIDRAAARAELQMSEDEESLAADLSVTGGTAWSRLYREITGRLTATVTLLGEEPEEMAVTKAINLWTCHPDRAARRAAFESVEGAFESVSVPIAAALNSIKGETQMLNKRRGWSDDLEPALFMNNVDRGTLEAMQSAVVASLPDFERFFHAKARALGVDRLAYYDLFAPVGSESGRTWAWDEATTAVTESFGAYSPRLAALAERAVSERWIDAEPRDGKGGGAFCAGVKGARSLVLLNFDGSFRSVKTLAHELGHAYHNVNLADRSPMQRATPMALAETASIFCETLMIEQGLQTVEGADRLGLLDLDLTASAQVVVDIHARFLFESGVFEKRARGPLSVSELNELMASAQREAYGDGLSADGLHRYAWAWKPHYYGSNFYNWPYTFGLLFGIGLYARYVEDPERFRSGYDDLLSSTGLADAADLGQRFDIDVRDGAFWTASIDVIRARITEFEKLI
ncbi:MAG TPA: M3 family oligoendopeptidase [Acidimicrobiales bacterium]|nr:M3 family oligoendopeptidase [Acidimicrobiales bacterium]